ncbi:ABC transporter ATP-binding protein [Streptomyces sulphureus]|uniref:ABC transporter ATP-binding protein n=1 Tax=Streptomyces sulphureus TaxID=47758 RepID=UPI000381D5FA|nr:ABC transporter ATP-binding protein [Streptomyces sulphureus]
MIIRQAERLLGAPTGMRGQILGYVTAGVCQGVTFATLVPVLRAVLTGDVRGALPWLIVAAVGALASGVAMWITSNKGYAIGVERSSMTLARKLASHVVHLPLGWFTKARTGELLTVMGAAQSFGNFPGMVLQQITVTVTAPATVVVVTAFVDWRLTVAFLALTPLGYVFYRRVQRTSAGSQAEEGASLSDVSSRVLEFAHAQAVLRAAGRTESGWESLDSALRADRSATVRSLNKGNAPMAWYMVVVEAGFALVSVVAAWLVLDGQTRIADIVALLILAVRFTEPVSLLAPYGTGVQLAATALDGVDRILTTPPLPEPATPRPPRDARVEFRDVAFDYGDKPVLSGLTLDCPPGTMTALVGPSGAGKTTVTRLAARFWDVDAGAVRIGGVDVREMDNETLMRQIAIVSQDVYLFDTTVEENVRIGRPDATDAQLRAAAESARLTEVVARLPLGWATPVGEGGSNLSGGERQRVSIARALLKDAPVVLLDEATAALDGENEAAVSAALREMSVDRTVLVVAHRLSTIASADQIAVLSDGRIQELGTHPELLASEGAYSAFWAARSQASNWQIAPSP